MTTKYMVKAIARIFLELIGLLFLSVSAINVIEYALFSNGIILTYAGLIYTTILAVIMFSYLGLSAGPRCSAIIREHGNWKKYHQERTNPITDEA